MDIITLLLLVAITWIGLRFNMAWLSVISGLLLVAYAFGTRTETKPVSQGGKPKIRPIIVKRRYEGPASIYPSQMKIKVNPMWNTKDWWENALGAAGTFGGLIAQGFQPKGR